MSDVFWANLPMTIGAIASLLTLLYQIWTRGDSKKGREEIKAELAVNTAATNLGNAKTDTLAAGLGVDTTKPGTLNAEVTQPIRP